MNIQPIGNPVVIKKHIKARSPSGLERAMLLNNLKNGRQYHYDVMESADKYWYAWFLDDQENLINKELQDEFSKR